MSGSTGAIFKFKIEFSPNAAFYMYRDAYIEGAACLLLNMIDAEDVRGSFADQFYRSNKDVVIAGNPDEQRETEYRYTITTIKSVLHIDAQNVIWKKGSRIPDLVSVYSGRLDKFINMYALTDDSIDAPPVVIENRSYNNLYKEFNFKLSQCVEHASGKYIHSAAAELDIAKRLATTLNLPKPVMAELGKMEEFLKLKAQHSSYDPTHLAKLVQSINTLNEARLALFR